MAPLLAVTLLACGEVEGPTGSGDVTVVDESHGIVGKVAIGASLSEVRRALGREERADSLPEEIAELGLPWTMDAPPGLRRGEAGRILLLRYPGWALYSSPRVGVYAIFVMMVPYCMLHLTKPLPEALASVVGAVALGFMSLRTRSIWMGTAIHVTVAWSMDAASLWRQGFFG